MIVVVVIQVLHAINLLIQLVQVAPQQLQVQRHVMELQLVIVRSVYFILAEIIQPAINTLILGI